MQQIWRGAAIAAALLAAAHSAHAQGFFKRLGDRAVEKVEENAERLVGDVIKGSVGPRQDGDATGEEVEPREEARAPAAATPAPAPAPTASAATKARYIDSLRAPPDVEAKKSEYNKFGEVSCNDCEGGIALDGRPTFPFDEFSGQYNERAKRAGNWPVGHKHRWKGRASTGTLTVTSEERVEGFRCRRLEYRVERGGASANRPGLICFGLGNRSSETENWHEIY